MATVQTGLSSQSFLGRVARSIPLIGQMIRDVERDVDSVFYLIAILITALVLAIKAWGLAALVLAALGLVPVMFVLLIWISLP